ncbi:beta family protein [Nonomuraea zeae]|uniref:T4 beta protein n=1 Tax=Nonomuraea zeae TaxID=1642303 RepID=A0A5S4H3Q8_9ACTN|nr:hypothetical protein [Nonomuraea zeae]TMR39572.1 hypothetical protein ETD85_00740 [Nonomuraea zeae]
MSLYWTVRAPGMRPAGRRGKAAPPVMRFTNRTENPAMTVYVPILQGSYGGFQALKNATQQVRGCLQPIIEVMPEDGYEDLEIIADRFARGIQSAELGTINIAIDTRRVADRFGRPTAQRLLRLLGRKLAADCPFRPVMHIDDDPDELDAVQHIAATHHMGVCLRISQPYAGNLQDAGAIFGQLQVVDQPAERTDVVIDWGFVEAAPDAISDAFTAISWPMANLDAHPWKSITVAAGSFPPPAFVRDASMTKITVVARLEVPLWAKIRERWPGAYYGDYVISNPASSPPKTRATSSLHYTAARSWILCRRLRAKTGAGNVFTDMCQSLVESRYWRSYGPAFSWGDQCFAMLACHNADADQARQWRAYSISHHLAVVAAEMQSQPPLE